MRIGILGDVHSNLEALNAVVECLLGENIDHWVQVGDIVGYGADPVPCLQRIRELGCTVCIGNHDAAVVGFLSTDYFNQYARAAIDWTREQLDESLPRGKPRRGRRKARASRDTIKDKTHISQRSGAADARAEAGHWEADLVICKRTRPVLVLHERETRLTLKARPMGKTAAETISTRVAILKRFMPEMRGSVRR